MKKIICAFHLVALLASPASAFAEDSVIFSNKAPQPSQEMIDGKIELEHVGASEELDRVFAQAGLDEGRGRDKNGFSWARITGGIMINIPFFDIEAFIGVRLLDGIFEVGVEGGIMPVIAVFYGGGAYVRVAPVHYGIGKRFYLTARARRYWIADSSAGVSHFDYLSAHVGYEHPFEDEATWFVEAGLAKYSRSFKDGDPADEHLLPSVAAGMRF